MRERKKHQRNENAVVLLSFVRYCEAHPQLRFWQALTCWAMLHKLMANTLDEQGVWTLEDTFYWTGRKGDQL